jgi:type IV pilus assembly protein PilV
MKRIQFPAQQDGVVLIEALLGILIFSIGILALIGMQSVAVKNTIDARYRTEAAYLANSILSQIRLDMANVVFYDDTNTGTYAPRTTFAGDGDPASRVTVTIRWLQPGETEERKFEIVGHVSRQ